MNSAIFRRQGGFSIVELMIAMLLSVTLSIAVVSVFSNNSYSFKQDEAVARMQDDARNALREIAFDISMAGFYAELHIPDNVQLDPDIAIAQDCGPAGEVNWMYQAVDAATGDSLSITAIDNASNADAVAAHSCFRSNELLEGTDIVSIKRVSGGTAPWLQNDAVYLRTNGTLGYMFRAPEPAVPPMAVALPRADWAFSPAIYYVRNYANVAGDGVPTLCRKVLRSPGPSMTTECLASGIEDLQIEYGIDTNSDGHPNSYISNPTLAQMQDVVTARIFLLARTTDADRRYTNDKTYSISNSGNYTPGDEFHRRVFSTNVAIQNVRTLNMMSL